MFLSRIEKDYGEGNRSWVFHGCRVIKIDKYQIYFHYDSSKLITCDMKLEKEGYSGEGSFIIKNEVLQMILKSLIRTFFFNFALDTVFEKLGDNFKVPPPPQMSRDEWREKEIFKILMMAKEDGDDSFGGKCIEVNLGDLLGKKVWGQTHEVPMTSWKYKE